ncbi:hypothetical protein G3O06_28670 [Burkholderia sp. Ac-20345]|uniref:hypothetical protein n=1 Tax=Burkholderia sp. Ac-20345 TaxID=2703891 RepID=UPI00197C7F15|nr:hypothetical protein [Burkholderia sp. Ac-20345]MBN3781484.1 hypothetical protein [Burkholderia sp. Ac-20345]
MDASVDSEPARSHSLLIAVPRIAGSVVASGGDVHGNPDDFLTTGVVFCHTFH